MLKHEGRGLYFLGKTSFKKKIITIEIKNITIIYNINNY